MDLPSGHEFITGVEQKMIKNGIFAFPMKNFVH